MFISVITVDCTLVFVFEKKKLSILDSSTIGLQLEYSGFETFLCTTITLAVFKAVGYIPEEKERLKMPTRCIEISFFSNFNILVGILFGPEDLFFFYIFITTF